MGNIDYLPENYKWNGGLVRKYRTKEVKMCNTVPIVEQCKKIINCKKETERIEVRVKFHFENREDEICCYSLQEITSGAYMRKLPVGILIEVGKKNAVNQVFQYAIQKQISTMKFIEGKEYEWGWNQCKFVFEKGTVKVPGKDEYSCAMQVAEQMKLSDGVVTGCLLAAIHGPMKKLLMQAGIQHDFTTCISGKSGIGKTSLAKRYCAYPREANVVFSLTSDRKELKKRIRDMSDMTIVIDDFNNSDSDRMVNRQLQTLAEIIQTSSDSGQVLVDDKADQTAGAVHVVTTVENVLKSISAINRCFLVDMEEPLSKECWDKLEAFGHNGGMWYFMNYFMTYISEKYSELQKIIPEDYRYYLTAPNWISCNIEQSKNRINATYAVQNVLFKILMGYFRDLQLDKKLLNRIDEIGRRAINNGCQAVIDSIEETLKDKACMHFLPALAEIFNGAIQLEEYTRSEKKYFKTPYDYAFVVLQNGYFSFHGKEMCERIAKILEVESVTPQALSKELKKYALARTDRDGNCSICWGSKKRMFHVRGEELLDLVYPYEIFSNSRDYLKDILYPYEE